MHEFYELFWYCARNILSVVSVISDIIYSDIALQYLFRIIFAISRIFAIPFPRGNDSLSRKATKNTDLREKLSHTESTESTEIFITNTDFADFADFWYCTSNILSVVSVISDIIYSWYCAAISFSHPFRYFAYFRNPINSPQNGLSHTLTLQLNTKSLKNS